MADAADRMAGDLADGSRAIAELAELFGTAARQHAADLAAWRHSLAWDRQAPAPRHAVIEHP